MKAARPNALLSAYLAILLVVAVLSGAISSPAHAVVTVQAGKDFSTLDAKRWLFFRASEGQLVKIRVTAPGGRPTVTIYRDKFPGGLVVAFASDLQGSGTAEAVFVAPRTTKYTVRVESGGQRGFTFSYTLPENLQAAGSSPVSPPVIAEAPKSNVSHFATTVSGPRVALVVGIGAYGSLGDLANPINDATSLANALRQVGFSVDLAIDPDQRALRQAIARLGERMAAAGPGATGLFFFAGHGVQSRGVNYLIPSRAAINREADLVLEAIPADAVLAQMQEAGVSTNILILDACRNTPFARSFRNATRGLAQMEAPNGSFIAYSTAPGAVAVDGAGQNSPFASALVREVIQPGQPIEAVFRNVRRSVLRETEGEQTPWDSSSLTEPFYFKAQ